MRLIFPVLAVLFLAGCDIEGFGPSDRFKADFHYTLKPAERISVENFNGEVEVAGWDSPSIEITGVKYASTQDNLDLIKIDVHESPAITEIRTIKPDIFHGNQGARYLIRAPRNTIVDRIVSSNGAVRVHDMTAAARLHTSNGAIRVENISGGLDAETSNGAIELDSVKGKVSLKTSNGRIRADELAGPCEATTSNGPVTLRFSGAPDGPTRIHTSNGSVDVTMSASPKGGIRTETSNGSITLNLPADTAARLNAHTSQSSVSSDFSVTGGSGWDSRKHELEGNIGAGGPLVELSTSNGGIHLRKTTAN
jgi:hypothetical protein